MSKVWVLVVALLVSVGCQAAPRCEVPEWDIFGRAYVVCDEGVPVCLLPDGEAVDADFYPNGELASARPPVCANGEVRCEALIHNGELVEPTPACASLAELGLEPAE